MTRSIPITLPLRRSAAAASTAAAGHRFSESAPRSPALLYGGGGQRQRKPASAPRCPRSLLAVIFATAALAMAALAAAGLRVPVRLSIRSDLTALGFGLGLLLARRFPVHLTEKTKTSVGTTPLFALALLFPAPLALLTAALAIGGAELWRRSRWFQALFNLSAGALQVSAAAALFGLLASHGSLASLHPADWLVPALAAACALYLANLLLVELLVSVQLRRLVVRQFWQRVWLSLPQEGVLALLGLMLALAAMQAPWAIPLIAAPAWLVYRSLHVIARGQAVQTVVGAPAHLAQLPRRLQLFIVGTCTAAALSGLTVGLRSPGRWTAETVSIAALAAGLAVASYRLPLKPAPRRTLVVDFPFFVAAVLVLAPGPAVLVVAVATLAGNSLLHRPWFNALFNVAQAVLAALAALAVYRLLAPVPLTTAVSTGGWLAAILAATTLWLVSVSLVDLIVAVQLRASPFRHWFATHRQSLLAYALLLPLAIAVVPVLARMLVSTALQLDAQADLLVRDLLAGISDRFPTLVPQAERLSDLAAALATAYGLPEFTCRQIALCARLAAASDLVLPAAAGLQESQHATGTADGEARARLLYALTELPQVAETLACRATAYDGSTDPSGPRGAGIPVAARILAVCEGWLALAAEQASRSPLEALTQMLAEAGRRWDPGLVGLLARVVLNDPEPSRQEA